MRLSTEIDILGRQGLNRSHTKVVRSSASLDSSSLSGGHARVAAWGSTLAMPHARAQHRQVPAAMFHGRSGYDSSVPNAHDAFAVCLLYTSDAADE